MNTLLRFAINVIVILLLAKYVPGMEVSSTWSAVIFAVVLGVINAVIKPVIIIFTLPINIMTIGLFTLIINALLFWLASSLVFGVEVESFASAFWAALILSLFSGLMSFLGGKK